MFYILNFIDVHYRILLYFILMFILIFVLVDKICYCDVSTKDDNDSDNYQEWKNEYLKYNDHSYPEFYLQDIYSKEKYN
jgi:hypothetical protein